jgi:hypothetical protein
MPPNYRKRRFSAPINKNDLKTSRNEQERNLKASSGTLRERFPQVRSLQIEVRMESPTGAILEESKRTLGLDESLNLNVPCQGGCSGGVFLLTDAVLAAIAANQEQRDGMGLCQMSSYRDPTMPCSTKFYYRVLIQY